MKTILVDDESWGLKRFEIECESMSGIEVIGKFQNPEDALALAREQRVDLALLDIEMPEMNGMDLADALKKLYPDIILIFISAYDKYMVEAMLNREADHFLKKPYTVEDVRKELERAKALSVRQRKRITIHTFGNFSVEVDNVSVQFASKYAKAILAILVDKQGLPVSAQDAYYLIWENEHYDRASAALYHNALHRLRVILKNAGIPELIVTMPHAIAIDKNLVDCDYYNLLDGDETAIRSFTGEYMKEWTWGEGTLSHLLELQADWRKINKQKK